MLQNIVGSHRQYMATSQSSLLSHLICRVSLVFSFGQNESKSIWYRTIVSYPSSLECRLFQILGNIIICAAPSALPTLFLYSKTTLRHRILAVCQLLYSSVCKSHSLSIRLAILIVLTRNTQDRSGDNRAKIQNGPPAIAQLFHMALSIFHRLKYCGQQVVEPVRSRNCYRLEKGKVLYRASKVPLRR